MRPILRSALPIGLVLVLFGLLTGCQAWPVDPLSGTSRDLTVYGGTSFGECLGYCRTELELTDTTQIYTKTGWDSVAYPPLQQERPMPADQWQNIVLDVDLVRFFAMDDVYGCPDCADGGAEWIEIDVEGHRKRVTFEYGNAPDPIAPLADEIRAIRAQFEADEDDA